MKRIFRMFAVLTVLLISVSVFAEAKTRNFDANKKPLPLGSTGVYTLVCNTDQEWNDSGNGFNTILENGAVRFKTQLEKDADILARKQAYVLKKSKFTKLDIRRAMRLLSQETILDNIIKKQPVFEKDWNDATEINLNDTVVQQALEGEGVDINAVKLKTLDVPK